MKTIIAMLCAGMIVTTGARAQNPYGQTQGYSPPVQQAPVWSPPVTGYPAPYMAPPGYPAGQPYTPPVTGRVNPYGSSR